MVFINFSSLSLPHRLQSPQMLGAQPIFIGKISKFQKVSPTIRKYMQRVESVILSSQNITKLTKIKASVYAELEFVMFYYIFEC